MDILTIIKSTLKESSIVNSESSLNEDFILQLSKASNLLIETFRSKGKCF